MKRPALPGEVIDAQLNQYREWFEGGNNDALILATLFCAKCGVPVPDWVDKELHQAWHRFIRREDADDIGEAFGIEWPKGSHKAAYRKKRKLQYDVYRRVTELHAQGAPIEDLLFAEVGKEFHIGKKLVSEYYYSAKKMMTPSENPAN